MDISLFQMTPTYTCNPTIASMEEKKDDESDTAETVTRQVWKKSGSCPEGTIPVRRIRKRTLLKAASVEDYGRKKHRCARQLAKLNDTRNLKVQLANHSVRIRKMFL